MSLPKLKFKSSARNQLVCIYPDQTKKSLKDIKNPEILERLDRRESSTYQWGLAIAGSCVLADIGIGLQSVEHYKALVQHKENGQDTTAYDEKLKLAENGALVVVFGIAAFFAAKKSYRAFHKRKALRDLPDFPNPTATQ